MTICLSWKGNLLRRATAAVKKVSLCQAWAKDILDLSASYLSVNPLLLPSQPREAEGPDPCMSPAFPKYLAQNWTEESAVPWPLNCLSPYPIRTTVLWVQPTNMPSSRHGQRPRTLSASPTFRGYLRMIKSDSFPIVCLSKSLNFLLFLINSHYKNIVLV